MNMNELTIYEAMLYHTMDYAVIVSAGQVIAIVKEEKVEDNEPDRIKYC